MRTQSEDLLTFRRVPTWALVFVPVLATVLSNADVIFLAWARPHTGTGELRLALATTIPLSVVACGLTLWLLLRLRREVDLRAVALADLEHALDRERLLRSELDHRVRNNLSALLALVGMYEESQVTSAEIVRSLRGKIITLRESYNLIAATHGEGIELADLLRAVVTAALDGAVNDAVTFVGSSVLLTGREANAFAMVGQELLTNAIKHGALRLRGGTIRVSWESFVRGNETRVALRWIEHPIRGDTQPLAGKPSGLGLGLVRNLAASDLRGGVSFAREGASWIVDLEANLTPPSRPALTRRSAHDYSPR